MGQDDSRDGNPTRSWRDIAEKLSGETDREKIADLSQRLIRALDEDTLKNKSA